jgi:hypothetical protein
MRNRFVILLLLALTVSNSTFAQILTGTVHEENLKPLPHVSVVATMAGSNTVEAFTQTNIQGYYQLTLKKKGNYAVTFSSLSFHKNTLHIAIDSDTVYAGNQILRSQPIAIQEIEIRPDVPVFYKKDTIVFQVASFLRGNERVVEDVLKNLPGIDVNQDGSISVQGRQVEKVLLEDDDLLNKGYALLTQGLKVEAIKQVEVIHGYTENKLAKNLVTSNKIALNLRLDNEAKQHFLGTLSGDYGIENNYAGYANVLGLSKQNKHYFTASANNTGHSAITDIAKILDMDEINFTPARLVNVSVALPAVDLTRSNFNQERMLSDNSIFRPDEKWKIHLSAATSADKRRSNTQMLNRYQTASSETLNHTLHNRVGENPEHYIGKAAISYDFSKIATLTGTTQYHHNRTTTHSTTASNGESFNEKLITRNEFFVQKLTYNHRYSDNSLLQINAQYLYSSLPQQYAIDSMNGNLQHPRAFYQAHTSRKQQFHLTASHTHRFENKHTLHFSLGVNRDADQLNVTKNNSGNAEGLQIEQWDYRAVAYYKYANKRISLTGGINLDNYHIQTVEMHSYLWLKPYFMLEWKPGKIHTLNTTWIYQNNYPPVSDIYPHTIRTSLTSTTRGADIIKPSSTHLMEFNYLYGNWTENFLANINLLFLKKGQYYSSEFHIMPNAVYMQRIPMKDSHAISLSGQVDYFVPLLSSNIKLSGSINQEQSQYAIKSLGTQNYRSTGYTSGISIKSALYGIFNFDAGGMFIHNRLSHRQDFQVRHTLYTDLILADKRWGISGHTEYSCRKGGVQSLSVRYCFVDMQMNYVLKPGKWILYLKGENLLNVKTYVENAFDEISESRYEAMLLPRKVLLSVEFKF